MTIAGIVLLLLAACFLVLAAHPFVIYPRSLRRLAARAPARPVAAAPPPGISYALCVCAYNEEAVIVQKAENMLAVRASAGAPVDLLVYVDGGTDRTLERLCPYADRITVVEGPGRTGKSAGMNTLAARTSADILVFSDANVMLDPAAVPALGAHFARAEVGCVCGHLVYTNADGTPTAHVGSAYWSLEERIKRDESALDGVMGADGSLFAVRRALHRPVPPELIDDMYLSLSILCDGHAVVRAEDAVAYEESVTAPAEEFRRKIRIACQAFNVHRRLWPRLRALRAPLFYMYVSHKLLRWLVAYNLAASVLAGGAGLLLLGVDWRILAVAVLLGAGLLVFGRSRIRPVGQLSEILLAFAGTGIGVFYSGLGRQFRTWTPAASIRQ